MEELIHGPIPYRVGQSIYANYALMSRPTKPPETRVLPALPGIFCSLETVIVPVVVLDSVAEVQLECISFLMEIFSISS